MKYLNRISCPQILIGSLTLLLIAIDIYLGHYFLALTLFVFFVLITSFKQPKLIIISLPIAAIILFYTPVLSAFTNLMNSTADLMNNPSAVIFNQMTPNTGREVLPRQALQINELIEEHGITGYQISNNIRNDEPTMQRVIEFTWPVTLDPTSPFLFGFTGDLGDMPDCQVIDSRQDIELGYCD